MNARLAFVVAFAVLSGCTASGPSVDRDDDPASAPSPPEPSTPLVSPAPSRPSSTFEPHKCWTSAYTSSGEFAVHPPGFVIRSDNLTRVDEARETFNASLRAMGLETSRSGYGLTFQRSTGGMRGEVTPRHENWTMVLTLAAQPPQSPRPFFENVSASTQYPWNGTFETTAHTVCT